MKAKEIFMKTMPFCIAKLMLGVITIAASLVLLLVLLGIGWLFGSNGVGLSIIIWIGVTQAIRFFLMHYVGYLVKAGHIAIICEAITTGKFPDNMVEVGKSKVKERFLTANVYFGINRLVSGAVKQLQNVLQKAGDLLNFIPGMGFLVGLGKYFIDLSLGYIDECCLGYTFYRQEQGALHSSVDAVVIYTQNWKYLLKNAVKTMAYVVLTMIGITLVVFLVLRLLFLLLHWNSLIAFLLSCFIAWVIKFAFLDSYILARTMVSFMEVAPTTQISFDLYSKLCDLSSKFRELFQKSKNEGMTYAAETAYTEENTGFSNNSVPSEEQPPKE